VVALRLVELGLLLVGLRLLLLGPVKDGLDGEHRHNRQHLLAAVQLARRDELPTQHATMRRAWREA